MNITEQGDSKAFEGVGKFRNPDQPSFQEDSEWFMTSCISNLRRSLNSH
jgi:hypothetical protein